MDDEQFVSRINKVLSGRHWVLPSPATGGNPDPDVMTQWAEFLGQCVKRGVGLADPRWQRIAVASHTPHTRLVLEDAEGPRDAEFRIGLQLLMGLLDAEDAGDPE